MFTYFILVYPTGINNNFRPSHIYVQVVAPEFLSCILDDSFLPSDYRTSRYFLALEARYSSCKSSADKVRSNEITNESS
jgi:hypothetical protein